MARLAACAGRDGTASGGYQIYWIRCGTVRLPERLVLIYSDFHGRVHKAMAKQLAQLLEPHRPLFIEEPLLPGHPNELKDLYNKTTIPIAVSLSIDLTDS